MTPKLSRAQPTTALSTNPRASLSAWLKYEPIVRAAISLHPKPYIFTPNGQATNSFVSKIRDAIRGKIAFDYPSEVSTSDVRDWWSEAVIRHEGQTVIIGLPEKPGPTPVGAVPREDGIQCETLLRDELDAFVLLISHGLLKGPVIVAKPSFLPDTLSLPPNVEFLARPDGSQLIF